MTNAREMKPAYNASEVALATPADHFVKVGGMIHAFADEDACWRFHQFENIIAGSGESSGNAKYFSRSELAAHRYAACPVFDRSTGAVRCRVMAFMNRATAGDTC